MREIGKRRCQWPDCGREFAPRKSAVIYCGWECAYLAKLGMQRESSRDYREARVRKRGYDRTRCDACGHLSMYTDVDPAGERGFSLCQSCGYSPWLKRRGFIAPGARRSQREAALSTCS